MATKAAKRINKKPAVRHIANLKGQKTEAVLPISICRRLLEQAEELEDNRHFDKSDEESRLHPLGRSEKNSSAYRIEIQKQATKELARIEREDRQRIAAAIDELAHNPRAGGCKKLRNRGGWHVRVGEYRILYSIEEERLLVLVVRIGHRREACR